MNRPMGTRDYLFVQDLKYMPKEIANIFPCNFATFPYIFRKKLVLTWEIIISFTPPSHIYSDKPNVNVTDHQLQMAWLDDRFKLYGPLILASTL